MNSSFLNYKFLHRLLRGESRLESSSNGKIIGTDIAIETALEALIDLVFEPDSVNVLNTSLLTHQVESYGSQIDLLLFIQNRYNELTNGGIWINHDFVAPENKDEVVFLWLNDKDGNNHPDTMIKDTSTYARYLHFIRQFRHKNGQAIIQDMIEVGGNKYACLSLQDACEFMLKKDNVDNWRSEIQQNYCIETFGDWQKTLQNADFKVLPHSKTYRNDWMIKKHWQGKVALFDESFKPMEFPETHAIILAEKS
ncbi:MAG: hypothetical protein MUF45_12735 [Spirosomaceae bacterium]|jgi:hypothetical protein|nr:hypothetical protein [Spirosomataceae bacterium]